MDSLNKLRMLAGLPLDLARMVSESRAKEKIKEDYRVPSSKRDLAPENAETHSARVQAVTQSVDYLKRAINALENIPPIDFGGDISHYTHSLKEILSSDNGDAGLQQLLQSYTNSHQKWQNNNNVRIKAEQEEEDVISSADDAVDHHEDHQDRIASAQQFDKDQKVSYHEKPMIVVVPNEAGDYVGIAPEGMEDEVGAIKLVHSNELEPREDTEEDDLGDMELHNHELSDDPEEFDDEDDSDDDIDFDEDPEIAALGNFKDENQDNSDSDESDIKVHRLGEKVNYYYDTENDEGSPLNVSDGTSNSNQVWKEVKAKNAKSENPNQLRSLGAASEGDLIKKVKIPASVKSTLKTAIDDVETGFKRLGAAETDAHFFYNSVLNAFVEIQGFLDAGTVYDIKQAQIFWSSLQSPIQHKFPSEVINFLLRGGETKSLKDYMKPVTDYPILGPRNS